MTLDNTDQILNSINDVIYESSKLAKASDEAREQCANNFERPFENRSEDYASFWQSFGQVIKEGMSEESSHRDRLAKLLRFASTLSVQSADQEKAQNVALADYIKRMKPKQEAIYYATADTLEAARNSPHLEVFRKKEIEVLLLTDRVDEWMLSYLQEFDGKKLLSVAKGGLDLSGLDDESEKEKVEASSKALKPLLDAIKDALADRVKEVRVTQRLTESPSCLVSEEGDISGHLERLLKQAGQKAPDRKPILEINPDHFLVKRLQTEQGAIKDWSLLLYEQALLAEGGQLADPGSFVKRLNDLLIALSMR
ncbi:MAG: hypothetical protein EBX59_11230 [Betaproteobacteria bacterium]|nr:hypothetical protein [Betaproteobacteria bacterium]